MMNVLVFLIALGGISRGFAESCPEQLALAHERFVEASNESGFRSLAKLFAEDGLREDNVLHAPMSLNHALAFAAAGAEGHTLGELAAVLGVKGLNDVDFRTLRESSVAPAPGFEIDNVAIANMHRYTFNPAFLAKSGASTMSLDFEERTAIPKINAYVTKTSHGLIPILIDEVPGDGGAMLVNTVYFEKTWAEPFGGLEIRRRFNRNGQELKVPVLRAPNVTRKFLAEPDFMMTQLGFGDDRYKLDLILPAIEADMNVFFKDLTAEHFKDLLARQIELPVDLGVFKFQLTYGGDLSEALRALGLKRMFNPYRAQFGPMGEMVSDVNLDVGTVLQRVTVELDEHGFRAAAVTSLKFKIGLRPKPLRETKVINRPVIFSLRDTVTGLVLFQGAITDPLRAP